MMRNDDPFLNFSIPDEIAENLIEFFPDFGDLSHEEVFQHQESVYQSLKGNDNLDRRSDHGQSSDSSRCPGLDCESSRQASFDSQLALDEALAWSLQDLEEGFNDLNISESTSAATGNREVSSRETTSTSINQTTREDAIDPDNMTYEQLRSLGESVGVENKGLSEGLLTRLPKHKYRTGIFSKKKREEELPRKATCSKTYGLLVHLDEDVLWCVICYMMVQSGEYLTTLPCAHWYHTKCITRWLKLNKNCPICQKEVLED